MKRRSLLKGMLAGIALPIVPLVKLSNFEAATKNKTGYILTTDGQGGVKWEPVGFSAAMKVEMAEEMLEAGLITTPEEYVAILNGDFTKCSI